MRELDGPIAELDFYYPDRSEKEAFAEVVRALLRVGAEFAGTGMAHTGAYAEELFGWLYEIPSEEIQVNVDNFDILMETPSLRLFRVDMLNAVGNVGPNVKERVVYVGLPKSDDKHPIGVKTEGEVFSYPSEYIDRPKAKEQGLKIYERFLALAQLTKPAYGAILVEDCLDNPATLRQSLGRNTTDTRFTNFYVSRDFIGPDKMARLRELYTGAYFEYLEDGVYISCYEFYNPEGKSLTYEHGQLSHKLMIEVAKIIADQN